MACVFLGFVVLICSIFYLYGKIKFGYWSKKSVKGPTPLPIVGNFLKVILGKESINECYKVFYEQYPDERFVGLYRGFTPTLLIRDPELIKEILIKDFPIFQERRINFTTGKLSKNLVETEGESWRLLRRTLSPIFTSSKLKFMTPIIQECIDEYVNYVAQLTEKNIYQDISLLKSKYTLRVVETCAFGLDLKTFDDKQYEFGIMAKKLLRFSTRSKILIVLDVIFPGIFKLLHTNEELFNFFYNVVKNVIRQRIDEPMKRKDFMDLMIEIRDQGKISQKTEDKVAELDIDDTMITAQSVIFYAAGFETSSAAMSFMAHELAWHQDVQNKVYQEICEVLERHNGELTYEAVMEMTYLEQVLDEILRLYPVISFTLREAQQDYTLPGTDITIPKGLIVCFSMMAMHRNEKYFSNPNEFNPDNFSQEMKQRLPTCAYIPFGEGPRNCIGMRFAKLQSKMGMAAFLKNFKLEPSPKTKRLLKYDIGSVTLKSQDGIWVKISKR